MSTHDYIYIYISNNLHTQKLKYVSISMQQSKKGKKNRKENISKIIVLKLTLFIFKIFLLKKNSTWVINGNLMSLNLKVLLFYHKSFHICKKNN